MSAGASTKETAAVAEAKKPASPSSDTLWDRFKTLYSKEGPKEGSSAAPAAVSDFKEGSAGKETESKKKKIKLPARDAQLEKAATKQNSTQGIVTGVDHRGLAVEYASDEINGGSEIWFNYVQKMKLVGFKDLSEIQEGDTVSVVYKEAPDHRKLVNQLALVFKAPKEQPEILMQEPG